MRSKRSPRSGKIDAELFNQVIQPRLGKRREAVLVGPGSGLDVGVIDIGHGRVMVTTTDPLAMNPRLGSKRSAWMALHVVASDLATSAMGPEYLTVDINLPPEYPETEFAEFWDEFHKECDRLGFTIVTGHTGKYEGAAFPIVGAATAISIGSSDRYVTPAMIQPGDILLMTKQAGLEAAVMLAVSFPEAASEVIGHDAVNYLASRFYDLSVVHDCSVAASCGLRNNGVRAMHDATEGGVINGVIEMANAASTGVKLDLDSVPTDETVARLCDHYGINPVSTVSEGCLLIAAAPDHGDRIIKEMSKQGVEARRIGVFNEPDQGYVLENGLEKPMEASGEDKYWDAYFRELTKSEA
jgi:hydrogenase maturation factor